MAISSLKESLVVLDLGEIKLSMLTIGSFKRSDDITVVKCDVRGTVSLYNCDSCEEQFNIKTGDYCSYPQIDPKLVRLVFIKYFIGGWLR